VQQVAAGYGLGDQMMLVQFVEPAAGRPDAGVIKGGGGVGVDVRAGGQAEPAKELLLVRGEILVGQVERGGDGQVLGPHDGQPVPCGGQIGRHFRAAAGWVMF